MFKKKSPSTLALLARLPKQIKQVVDTELTNAKAEVSGRIKNLVIAIVLFVVALIFLYWTIAVLLTAAIAGIAEALPVWLAALLVAGGGLVVIAVCIAVGVALAKRGNPVPSATIARVKADFAAAAEMQNGANKMRAQPGKKGTNPGETGVWE